MKLNSLKKVFTLLLWSILCCLINASLSGAEQQVKDLSSQIFSSEDLKALNIHQEKKVVAPVIKPVAASKDMASSFDVKFAFNELFKAFLSLGDRDIRDMFGRDIGQSYNAVIGFQITLQ